MSTSLQQVLAEASYVGWINRGYPQSFTQSNEYKIALGSRAQENHDIELAKALLKSLNEQKIIDSGEKFDRQRLEKLCALQKSLCLSGEKILSLPSFVLTFFKNIEKLEFARSGIRKIPDEMAEMQNLTTLKIVNAYGLRALGSLKALSNVKELVIRDCCNLNGLPEGLWENWSRLEKCTIDECYSFRQVPKNFFKAPNLKECRFNITQIENLPEIPKGSNLEVLEVIEGALKSLPNSIKNAVRLKHLDIGDNPFEEIPEVVKELKQLKYLGLGEYKSDEPKCEPKIPDLSNLANLNTLVVPKGWFEKTDEKAQNLVKYLPKVFAVELENLTNQEGLNTVLKCKGIKRNQTISGKAEKKFKTD